jgi:hypothetical protein
VADHEAQELARWDAKDTLLRVEFPVVAPEIGKGLGEVGDEIVLHHGLDNYVINVCFDVIADLGLQALLDGLLVGHSSILEAERHGRVALDAMRRYERRVVLVRDLQGYLVIP